MLVIPAIDLQDGCCVRLHRGDPSTASVFNEVPADQARAFESAGCRRIHVVDLDGAFAGHPANAGAVESIINSVDAELQLGGGIRDLSTIDRWLGRGINQVILGTAAVENPELVKQAAAKHPGKIIVGIDARDGLVATRGWAETTGIRAVDLARQLEDSGTAAIIFTDIATDGMMDGPNLEAVSEVAGAVAIPVIASGGVTSIEDLRQLASLGAGLRGAIVGRAIYEGAIDLAAAIAELAGPEPGGTQ